MVPCKAVLMFLLSLVLSVAAHAADSLQPPSGFMQPPAHRVDAAKTVNCPAIPTPFTGTLDFRSKYEGSDSARATLNPQAEAAFHDRTRNITAMESLVSKQVIAWARSGDPRYVACVVNALSAWADAGALTGAAANHTGKSMRKWALASFSSAWLQLAFSPAQPLAAYTDQQKTITRWLSQLGTLTASEWRDLPLDKVNNHSYWAAWALMSTAVVTQRQDLFHASLAIYRTAMQQVDAQGFLANELRRRQRAFSYHNYAIQPLVMIALFARANGVDVTTENNRALQRLGAKIIASLDDPAPYAQQTGEPQDRAFLQHPTNLAWLEAWCQLQQCDAALNQRITSLRPLQNTRMGGDMTHLFAAKIQQRDGQD